MIAELVTCVSCGSVFPSVEIFEAHMRTIHGPGSLPSGFVVSARQVIDDDDDDDDDDDNEENGELFPHNPAQVARLIETYRERSEAAIAESRVEYLAELRDLVALLESELLRRAMSTCEQTSRVAALRRMLEFVLRDSKDKTP